MIKRAKIKWCEAGEGWVIDFDGNWVIPSIPVQYRREDLSLDLKCKMVEITAEHENIKLADDYKLE